MDWGCFFGCWRTGHGGHRPTVICHANHSRTGSPCPVLQQEVKVFIPLSSGEGLGVGCLFDCWRTGHGDPRPTEICHANYSRTGSLCPVLQQEVRVFTPLSSGEGLGWGCLFDCWRTGHGDPRPTEICHANYSRTGSLCPVLQQEVRVFTPLSSWEGLGVGLFIFLLEDGARRPPSYLNSLFFSLLLLLTRSAISSSTCQLVNSSTI